MDCVNLSGFKISPFEKLLLNLKLCSLFSPTSNVNEIFYLIVHTIDKMSFLLALHAVPDLHWQLLLLIQCTHSLSDAFSISSSLKYPLLSLAVSGFTCTSFHRAIPSISKTPSPKNYTLVCMSKNKRHTELLPIHIRSFAWRISTHLVTPNGSANTGIMGRFSFHPAC